MIIDNKIAKRAAIYVFHDGDKIVDDYAPVFLKELKRFTEYLLVVINGEVNEEGLEKFKKVSDDILIRPNEGYDITGYREGIKHITWEKLDTYAVSGPVNTAIFPSIYNPAFLL